MRLYCILFIFCLFPFVLKGQIDEVGDYFIKHYSSREYNSLMHVFSIVEDKEGVMYYATNAGVTIFDGNKWSNIPVANRSWVRYLTVDKTGRVYVGAQVEFGYIEPDSNGSLTYYSLVSKVPESERNFDDVFNIFVTDTAVVFQTQNKIFSLKEGKIRVFKPESVFHFSFLVNNQLYVTDLEKGLYKWENGVPTLIWEKSNLNVYGILPFTGNKILIIDNYSGFYIYDGVCINKWEFKLSNYLLKQNIIHARRYQNYVIVCTIYDGIFFLDLEGNVKRRINRSNGLQSNTAISSNIDHSGNLWIGMEQGVDYIELASPFTWFNEKNNILGSPTIAMVLDSELLVGTNQGAFIKKWELTTFDSTGKDHFQLIKNGQGEVRSFYKWGNSRFCGNHKGIVELNKNGAVPISDFMGGWVIKELKIKPGFAISGHYQGLQMLQRNKNGKVSVLCKVKGFSESSRFIEEDDDGTFVISHENKGVWRLRLSEGLDSVVDLKFYDSKNGLPSNIKNKVTRINGEILFTTSSGIYFFDKKLQRFREHTEFTQLTGKRHVKLFKEDAQGNIYFLVIEPDKRKNNNKSIVGVILKEKNGYRSSDFNFNKISNYVIESITPIDTKNVLLSCQDGIIVYHPDKLKVTGGFQTYVRKVSLRGNLDSVLFGGFKMSNQPAILSYDNNSLSFEVGASFSENYNETEYQYLLDGFDYAWTSWTSERIREYTNLPEGSYVLKVRARNIYQSLSNNEALYPFQISPPWYRQWFSWMIYVVLFFVFIIVGNKWYSSRLLNKNLELERIVKQRIQVIEEQKEEIAHQRDKIEVLFHELEESNKELEDSIDAAKTIQNNQLPKFSILSRYFNDHFLLYLPKHKLSGDFYWCKEKNGKVYFALIDCTGHGVPGALLTMIASDKLNHLLDSQAIPDVGKILTQLNAEVVGTAQNSDDESQMNGMDIALCEYDPSINCLKFSGAKLSLVIYQNSAFTSYKGNRFPIGTYLKGSSIEFAVSEVYLNRGDRLLLYTDGLVDQLGGDQYQKLMTKRVMSSVEASVHLPVTEQGAYLHNFYNHWKGDLTQLDDVTLWLIEI